MAKRFCILFLMVVSFYVVQAGFLESAKGSVFPLGSNGSPLISEKLAPPQGNDFISLDQKTQAELELLLSQRLLFPADESVVEGLERIRLEMQQKGLSAAEIEWTTSYANYLVSRRMRSVIYDMILFPPNQEELKLFNEGDHVLYQSLFEKKDAGGKTAHDYFELLHRANVRFDPDHQSWDLQKIIIGDHSVEDLQTALSLWVAPEAGQMISSKDLDPTLVGHLTMIDDVAFVPKPYEENAVSFEVLSIVEFQKRLERDPEYPGKRLQQAIEAFNVAVQRERLLLTGENLRRIALSGRKDRLWQNYNLVMELFTELKTFLKRKYFLSPEGEEQIEDIKKKIDYEFKTTAEENDKVQRRKKKALYDFIIYRAPALPFSFGLFGVQSAILTIGAGAYCAHAGGQGLVFNQDFAEQFLTGSTAFLGTKISAITHLSVKLMALASPHPQSIVSFLRFLTDHSVISRGWYGYLIGSGISDAIKDGQIAKDDGRPLAKAQMGAFLLALRVINFKK